MLASGLVAALGFEEGSGTMTQDSSGLNNNGVINGATWTLGKHGDALSFNGANNWVTVPDSASLDLTSGMTLEAWVFPTTAGGTHDVIVKESPDGDIYNMYAGTDPDGLPQADVRTNGSNKTVTGAALPINTWTHLAVTYDGGTLKLFTNGVQSATLNVGGDINTAAGVLRVGGNSIWGEYFNGKIDDIRVYNNPLTAAQITTDMNTAITIAPVVDTTPPVVSTVSPKQGGTNAALGGNVTVTFNEPVLASTVTNTTIELRDPNGVLIPATVTYDNATRTATLDPLANLTSFPNSYFNAVVHGGSAGVKDTSNNALAADYNWSFTTGTPNLQDNVVISGLVEPTTIAFSPDGRVFVAEKSGLILVYHGVTDTHPVVFADLNVEVHDFWDRGLLGMALSPTFPVDPRIWIFYTYDGNIGGTAPKYGTPGVYSDPGPNATTTGATASARLSVITASGDHMVAGSEKVLINDWFQQFPSHSIGTVAFGPDGMLYAAAGDASSFDFADYGQIGNPGGDPTNEGGALRAQDLRTPGDPTTLDGSMIRIDPNTGLAAPGNPLYTTGNDANAKRIISDGLRNPFRFTFRPGTNQLWIADVGWNDWEEIDRTTVPDASSSLVDFGWPAYEGNARQGSYAALNLPIINGLYNDPSAVTFPYYTYNHYEEVVPGSGEVTGGSSITGITFYQSGAYPVAFDGALFFTDFTRQASYVMFPGSNGEPDPSNIQRLPTTTGAVELTVGPDSLLYYVDLNGGTVHRLDYFGSNRPPTAVIGADQTSGPTPLTVHFTAAGSSDPDPGDTLSYAWDLDNDGQFDDSTSITPTVTFPTAGNMTVRLQVTDNHGSSSTSSILIGVGNTAPTMIIDTPSPIPTYKIGDTINFSGHGTDPEDGSLAASNISWTLLLHNGAHVATVQSWIGASGGSFTAPDSEYPAYLELRATATDSGGLQSTSSITINPKTVTLHIVSTPPGLQVVVNNDGNLFPGSRTVGFGPFDWVVIPGSLDTLAAITPQTLNSTAYFFSTWSDGGAATHDIVAPTSNTTYTATFVTAPGPVAAYNFDAGSGATTADATGNGHTGTITGASWITTGHSGNALSFNGTSNWVTVPDAADLELTTGMTMEAWVYPTSNTGTRDVMVKETTGGDIYNLYARTDPAGKPEGNVRAGGTNKSSQGNALAINTWSHLASTYDGTSLKLYINGVLASTTAVTGLITTSTGVLRIGGNSIWGEYFAGRLDDVRLYNRALSAAEVTTDMNTAVSSAPVNHAPTAVISANPTSGSMPLLVNFSGTGSSDPDAGDTLTYAWDLDNDGQFDDSTSSTPSFTFTTSGTKTVRLQVTDSHGAMSPVATTTISVTNPNNQLPTATIDTPLVSQLWKVGDVISFSGHATDPENGNLTGSSLSWSVLLHSGATETVLQTSSGASGTFTVPNESYPSTLEFKLTATDADGGQNTKVTEISPQTTVLNFSTTPAGLSLIVNGVTTAGPFTRTVITGSSNTLSAAASQLIGSTTYYFSAWSDSGSASHTVVAAASPVTYTATYVTAPGPVAAYNFDAGSGATTADATGNGHTGTITGASWITTGHSGNALSFNGTSNWVTVPDAADLELTTGMTMEAWVYPTSNTGTRDVMVKETTGGDIYNLYARTDPAGKPEGNVRAGGTNKSSQGNALAINTWSHLASTYDGTSLKLYINGVLASTTAVTGLITTSTGVLRIGGNSIWGEYFAGRLDDVRLYNRALSAAEVTTDMNTAVSSAPVNHAPTAVISANPTSGSMPLLVNFSGTGSSDPDAGDTLTYAWDLDNDGQFDDSTSSTPSFTFTTSGTKTVRLQVTDSHGAMSPVATTTISVTNPNNQLPTATIDTPLVSQLWKVGDVISFSGHATDPENGNLTGSSLSWSVLLHSGATETVLQTSSGASGTFTVPNESYPSTLEFKLTATDADGGQNTKVTEISPQTTVLNFSTTPAGLSLIVNGVTTAGPFTRTVITGSSNTLSAAASQLIGSTTYYFSAWSDSGSASHTVVAAASPVTYTATYVTAPGPVAAYNFDAGSGATTADATGNGHTGTITGASWITTGHSGNALSFNGTSNWVTVPDAADLELTTGMTMEAWVYPTSNTGTRDVMVKETTGGDIYNLYARTDPAGKPEGNVRAGGTNKSSQGNALAINTWSHLASTYDGTSLKLYINGVLASTTAVTGLITTSTGVLRIGGNSIWGEYFAGRLDDVRLYNRALSAAEVTTDMNTAVSSAPAALAAVATPAPVTTQAPTRTSVFSTKKITSVMSLIDSPTT